MKRFSRGSEWRKWDLHVHPPGTKLNDNYDLKNGELDWDRFCSAVHDSDVEAIGIADYFSLDGFFVFKEKYDALYAGSEKVFFPNLEVRLNETVNGAAEVVDYHIIFPPDLTRAKADEFLQALKTQKTDANGRQRSCAEMKDRADYEEATISRADLKSAISSVFGDKAVLTDHFISAAAVNNNGIRPDAGNKRKMSLSDEIDKCTDGFFGNPGNKEYFLDPNRLEADQVCVPKPVFAGCDAHSFEDLDGWLGKEVVGDNDKHTTWVKADLSYEGLQQTLVEPEERVRIQATLPDKKEPYKVISRIVFKDSDDFPAEVVFNPGLNAIIGSRSSGKSALLAYTAHAVDPEYTVKQQVGIGIDEKDAGPGASVTWADVADLDYSVEWGSAVATEGQVIYIPQNSLYAISERPDEITAKIQPAVFRGDPDFEADFRKAEDDIEAYNETISASVSGWFDLAADIVELNQELKDVGDRKAISERAKELQEEITRLQKASELSAEEVAKYQEVMGAISANNSRLDQVAQEQRELAPYVKQGPAPGVFEATGQVGVAVDLRPSPATMPVGLRTGLETAVSDAKEALLKSAKSQLEKYRAGLDVESAQLQAANEKLERDNQALIEKSAANTQISALVKDHDAQKEALAEIDRLTEVIKAKTAEQAQLVTGIANTLGRRDQLLDDLKTNFNNGDHTLEEMEFGLEVEWDPTDIAALSSIFSKRETSPYLDDQKQVDLTKVLSEPDKFIQRLASGKQKLKQGEDTRAAATSVLTATKDIRFVASLDGDRIGGFKKSSMTPGKQALFALTLILAEQDEPWPLLIDQPEDDLDSRSVCDVIIKDLMRRKRERQVIMVSHNANLVIGADSEEVIVANRHGDDRPNKDGQTFAYLTGSLEHSKPYDLKEKSILESKGIREHACEILDGGEEAFQKRKDKYRI